MPLIPKTTDPADAAAIEIRRVSLATYQNLLNVFTNGVRTFWMNPQATPTEIAAALGTDGVEVFRLHGAIGQLLASVDPAAIAETASLVGQFSYHDDGRVTVVAPDSPTPAPPTDPAPTPIPPMDPNWGPQ